MNGRRRTPLVFMIILPWVAAAETAIPPIPGSSTDALQVTVSAINRNFPGRSGPGQVWLASPATVMASALAGELISFAGLQERVARAS